MRPSVGGNALPTQSNKPNFADADGTFPTPATNSGLPTTFFMASESMLEASRPEVIASGSGSNFGIQSLEETIGGEDPGNEHEDSGTISGLQNIRRRPRMTNTLFTSRDHSSDSIGQASVASSTDSSPPPYQQQPHHLDNTSQPFTPILFPSPAPGSSLPSSPKSTSTRYLSRQSDEDSLDGGGSQAIISSGDDDELDVPPENQAAALQLIMPSIMMPRRRPFTQDGKNMGRLKVLLAGATGTGKTSLIKSIVQVCEDIVHVDPLTSNPPSLRSSSTRKQKQIANSVYINTSRVTEVFASTKPYPPWWSDIEESNLLRRRKSAGDAVLERNICFVDTPGYNSGTSIVEGIQTILQYVESQISKTTTMPAMSDGDLLSILDLKAADIEFLKQLSHLTNFVPLIAKSDKLSDEEAQALKKKVSEELQAAGLKPFALPSNRPEAPRPFTVCSSVSNDEENMDASLLMSPDYVQPLLPSELSHLVELIFQKDHASWLKHSAAQKIVQWRKAPRHIPRSPLRDSIPPQFARALTTSNLTSSASSLFSPTTSSTALPYPSSPFTQARLTDHTQREERLAQVHLANWASSLQRSLQNERLRYEALARGDRAAWLKEKLGECLIEGGPDAEDQTSQSQSIMTLVQTSAKNDDFCKGPQTRRTALSNPADPLGLMQWNEMMRQRGWIAFQVVGSLGVLSAVAVWIFRQWGFSMNGELPVGWGARTGYFG